MSYPDTSPAVFTWVGAQPGSYPDSSPARFSWSLRAHVAAGSPLGVPAAVARQINLARGGAPSMLGVPVGVVSVAADISVWGAAPSPLGLPAAVARIVSQARASAPSPLGAPAAVAVVIRYELVGEVRDQGVLVNRRVRAHRLADGALVGEGDTVAGRFRLHAGFAPALHYVIPLDMSETATDYTPPVANRVLSVLAED